MINYTTLSQNSERLEILSPESIVASCVFIFAIFSSDFKQQYYRVEDERRMLVKKNVSVKGRKEQGSVGVKEERDGRWKAWDKHMLHTR